jgi:hypothetical protein
MAYKGFGKKQDPKQNGQKGGINKGKSVKVQMAKKLRELKNMPYDQYLEELHKMNPNLREPGVLDQILLSGEKGHEYLMSKELEFINANLDEAIKMNKDVKERAMLAKERYYLWKTNKDSVFGQKTRSEVKLSGESKLQLALEKALQEED